MENEFTKEITALIDKYFNEKKISLEDIEAVIGHCSGYFAGKEISVNVFLKHFKLIDLSKEIEISDDETFDKISPSEHEDIKGKYNKIFDGTDLEAKVFEINGAAFNSLVKQYKSSKKYLDIYFILDSSGERNLMLKFTSESKGENFTLKNGDHQYIINKKNLQLADSESLLDLRNKFVVRYENEITRLPEKPHTILTRDELAEIKEVSGILKLYPCIDSTDRVSLTSEYNDASGGTNYGNRGSLYP